MQTVITVPTTGWKFFLLQPYNQVYADLRYVELFILILTIVFLLVVGIVVFPITKQIYRPLDSIVTKLKNSNLAFSTTNMHDDILILNNAYTHLIKQEDHLKKISSKRVEDIIQSYHIKNLLCDSSNAQENQLEILEKELDYDIASPNLFAICCIKIRNVWNFKEEFSRSNREIFYYAISNIACELVGEQFPNIAVDFADSHVALILTLQEPEKDTIIQSFSKIAAKLNENIRKNFNIQTTISLSQTTSESQELTVIYEETLRNLTYMFVKPNCEFLTCKILDTNNVDTRTRYSSELDSALAVAIKQRSHHNIERCLDEILAEITVLNYNAIATSVTHLVVLVTQVLSEINASKIQPSTINYKLSVDELLALDNCIILREQLSKLINIHIDSSENITQEKHLIIVETLKQIIQDSYQDPNLSLQFLADQIKMSAGYIGKIFKSLMRVSVAEYINIARMEQARVLLEISEQSIVEIMKEVGIENESQFYRLFRRHFGLTPKEYILGNSLAES